MRNKVKRKIINKKQLPIVIGSAVGVALLISLALILPSAFAKKASSEETEAPTNETTEIITTAPEETTAEPETTEDETTAAPETAPAIVNPLTGLETDVDRSGLRPVAVMINNIKISTPQIGIRSADIMYECLAEGDITRLMIVTSDYASIGTLGSVRSARDYFLDFAQNHDALFVHAGGSPDAYTGIAERGINNLDGVRMYIPDMFYRDEWRMKNMGYEHSLMTTGEKIVNGIAYLGYRTQIKENFKNPFEFVDLGKSADMTGGKDALHVNIPYSVSEIVDMVYNESTGLYDRYQFNGVAHVDGENNQQMAFKNIFIICCDTNLIAGDDKNRINVATTGTDTGYYITDGKVIEVKWTKTSRDSEISFATLDGQPLKINRGTTYVAVTPQIKNKIQFNAADLK